MMAIGMTLNIVGHGVPDLPNWLRHLESLHPKTIDLGLDRVVEVKQRLNLNPPFPIITVAGTNGKGSTCAMLEAILLAAGYRIGLYTSPHLLRYNERVRINGFEASDEALCEAFAAVEQARGEVSLTYFEFGTLAAVWLFVRAGLSAVILEVGLGGRLDAVNAFDADCAVLTSVDFDHMDYLGDSRLAIGYEKAGIFRAGKPAVCGEFDVPYSVLAHAEKIGADLRRIGSDFGYDGLGACRTYGDRSENSAGRGQILPVLQVNSRSIGQKSGEIWTAQVDSQPIHHESDRLLKPNQWRFTSVDGLRLSLPYPAMRGTYQLGNASTCLAALEQLGARLPVSHDDIRRGLLAAVVPGRFQVLPGRPQRIFDVAHNPHAARALAENLRAMPPTGKTFAVFAMLRDKDIAGVVRAMKEQVDRWLVAGIGQPRGASAEEMLRILEQEGLAQRAEAFPSVAEAYRHACAKAVEDDKILIFGSFYTVAEAMTLADSQVE
ncbi:MAG: bifunctional tetrahydrofolate synthase/dihydrofolate synthase [Hydrogenophilales bacterium CG_4_9_14_3_um_filter_59_35]|nr:MAG: bifunctional tetrahydrofolate synthase/dihydrofolate synthase [Hydrogenophilales bacterium CG18_big_fil_WC_8_21_14_2_50_58_12]PIY00257.1 MAG: bifunctional tetrahydrofolate synthase/dihydrofolate synthase [Hydrogenophilales bacterium CG_4_10_14_3_um_filter_58_23]PJB03527.1 MAG: bifunctional tetrahydrofolate synthase/dihydrofolate synthase [Hydrogenophilales bacterium CG_4_9_14_3_um_filter_59_35]